MPRKSVGQMGFLDGALARRRKRPERLAEISALIDWSGFARLLSGVHAAAKGEPAWPPLVMFKVLLLQRWYDLSDEAMEEALWDRLSFQAFCGLCLEDGAPDHSTIWRFRETLTQAGLADALFEELSRQLAAKGAFVKSGALIDASLIEAAARRPSMKEGKTSAVDPDARFGANNEKGRFTFGYKLHLSADRGSGLVRGVVATPANVQEVAMAPALLKGDEGAVFADRGFDAKAFHEALAERGIKDGVMRRGRAGKPLSEAEIVRNHELSLIRRPVEAVFGVLKRIYRMRRLRYYNLARNALSLKLACMAYNIRRYHKLAAQ